MHKYRERKRSTKVRILNQMHLFVWFSNLDGMKNSFNEPRKKACLIEKSHVPRCNQVWKEKMVLFIEMPIGTRVTVDKGSGNGRGLEFLDVHSGRHLRSALSHIWTRNLWKSAFSFFPPLFIFGSIYFLPSSEISRCLRNRSKSSSFTQRGVNGFRELVSCFPGIFSLCERTVRYKCFISCLNRRYGTRHKQE